MKPVERARTAWNHFWFTRVDPLPFSVTRIGVALAGLFLWAGTGPALRRYYTDVGELPIAAARAWAPAWTLPRIAFADPLGSVAATRALYALQLACLIGLVLGRRVRLSACGAASLSAWFLFRNPILADGGVDLLRLLLAYVAAGSFVAPPDPGRTAAKPAATMPVWPLRLIQIQLAYLYLEAGFWKVIAPPWWDGTALYLALANDTFIRFGAPMWTGARPLYAAVSMTVAWWEALFPVLIVARTTRRAALVFGACFHAGTLAAMNVGVFPLAMLAAYPAFLDAGELRGLGGPIVGRLPPSRARESAEPQTSTPSGSANTVEP